MKQLFRIQLALILSAFLLGCGGDQNSMLQLITPKESGIGFENTINETDSFNILTYEYIYNGGGVGVADFNNDGRSDIFFTGNQVPNRLYINQGDFRFKDVTETAQVNVPGRWNSGVTVVDINHDGWQDIYVCATMRLAPELRKNMLFVNEGLDEAGNPRFIEMAAAYGIDFSGHSVASAFFDYDKDGDLDLYILVNVKLNNVPTNFRAKITDGTSANNDRLFRNNGDGTFADVTMEAGIRYEGFGLGLAISDFNNDGWPDIYTSNDYLSNDILYLNQHDGTFVNATAELLGHQSQFSMGNDAADVNNDGLTDLVTLDMLPENSERKKTTIGNKSYQTYINNAEYNYQHQYVRNMLQLNNGAGIRFSEVGQLAGVFQTEWSWSALFADFDNDGWRDLLITNGFPKDITDKDFANYRSQFLNLASPDFLVDSIPVVKIPNYAYKNDGGLHFTDVSAAWGVNQPSFSNGAAFADLDNDGDLDYIVNNINSPAFLYRNTLNDASDEKKQKPHYLRIKLEGPKQNTQGLGTKITLFTRAGVQYHDHSVYRGFLSSVEGIVHFGLGNQSAVDSLKIVWPNGAQQLILNPSVDQVLTVSYQNARAVEEQRPSVVPPLVASSRSRGLTYAHQQTDIIDFNIQRTIPHKFSQFGPALAVGDVDGNGFEDLFIGGSPGSRAQFILQKSKGVFSREDRIKGAEIPATEDGGALLFDVDGDGDLDLYLARSGFEWERGNPQYTHQLLMNNGKGFFEVASDRLPAIAESGSCVRAADYDADGDLDLFVGGRVVPGQYPLDPASLLLQNNGGKLIDVTKTAAPLLKELGMVTDALWSDVDGDGKVDLVVARELKPIVVLKNNGNSLTPLQSGLEKYAGWWNSLVAHDFDADGDVDLVAGNLGANNLYHVDQAKPVRVFAKDLDGNGSIEALTFCYSKMLDGSEQLCPVHFWDELNQQSPRFRRQFSRYKHFSKSTWGTLLSEKDKEGALIMDVNHSLTSYLENEGNGTFKVVPLPSSVQFAPVNGLVVSDLNSDGNADVVMVGNDYGNEVFIGRHDAFTGMVLLGNGKGAFEVVPSAKSGFYVPNDAKALVRLRGADGDLLVASQNRDSLKVFEPVRQPQLFVFSPQALDSYAVMRFANGREQKVEFYHGSGYLSQSTRQLTVPTGVVQLRVVDSRGQSREVVISKKNPV